MIGDDKAVGCRPCLMLIQCREHPREIVVSGFYRGNCCGRARCGFVLGVIGFAEPEQRKLWNALLPKKISQRFRCPCIPIGWLRRRRKCSERFYNLGDGFRGRRVAGENVLSAPRICMSIEQNPDCLRDSYPRCYTDVENHTD